MSSFHDDGRVARGLAAPVCSHAGTTKHAACMPAALSEASDGEAATVGGALDEAALHPWPLLGVELAHLVPDLLGEESRPPLLPVPRHSGLPPAVHPQPRRAQQVLAAVADHSSHNPHVLYSTRIEFDVKGSPNEKKLVVL